MEWIAYYKITRIFHFQACQILWALHSRFSFFPRKMELQIISCVSVVFILASTISFILKTDPSFQIPELNGKPWKKTQSYETISVFYRMHEVETSGYTNYKKAIGADKPYTIAHPYFFFIDLICNIWFTIELVFSIFLLLLRRGIFRWSVQYSVHHFIDLFDHL